MRKDVGWMPVLSRLRRRAVSPALPQHSTPANAGREASEKTVAAVPSPSGPSTSGQGNGALASALIIDREPAALLLDGQLVLQEPIDFTEGTSVLLHDAENVLEDVAKIVSFPCFLHDSRRRL